MQTNQQRNMQNKYKAALFDLDGVVFDTEPQYTIFWGNECRHYHPEIPGLEYTIKGQTLTEILENHFAPERDEWDVMIQRLNIFEENMNYIYVKGFENFIDDVKRHNMKTAVVTSSNKPKMESVFAKHPELKNMFDIILTSEFFEESKPHPDCYIKGAQSFELTPEECIVFEDSFNGLKSGRASGAKVVGLSTSNPEEKIKNLCDIVIPNFDSISIDTLIRKL